MGKQLDSLADVVSFGVAPGMILYQLLRISFAREADGLDASVVWLFPALVLPCATAWRLAKFNIDTEQQFSFKGLPSPASGLFVASLPLIIFYDEIGVTGILYNNWVLYLIILLLSFLMVCNLPLMSLKIKDFSVKNNLPKFILIGVGIVSAILLQWLAVPIVILAYVILSLALKNKTT